MTDARVKSLYPLVEIRQLTKSYLRGKQVLEVLQRVNRELGTITIVITHNAAIAALADRVIRISGGRIGQIDVNRHKLTPADISW